ncbi:hypothetical protein [Micromonospora sp. DT47]|uniref:hypothetical protein n=1 Tax=Micromonospora sp. DT47 TaxID=3393431 RepID=UPI003CE6782B
MRHLPAFVAVGVLGVVLGLVGSFGLRAALSPSAEQVSTDVARQIDTAPPPLYGAR